MRLNTLTNFQFSYCGPLPAKFDLNWAAAAIRAAWLDNPPGGILPKLEFDPICADVNIGGHTSGLLVATPVEGVIDTDVTEVA